MEVGVLGPVHAVRSGEPVPLGTFKQRALLAALALHRDRTVAVDTIVDLLWGDRPPAAVGATLQSYVSGLRRALEPDRPSRAPAAVLVTTGPGYALRLPAEQVDAGRFDRLVAASHRRVGSGPVLHRDADELAEVVTGLDEALALWRGDPFPELGLAPDAVAERARLGELHLVALEDRAVARLALGEHATVAAQLESLTAAHPLRERLWALRVLALVRSQRQADALEVLREVRRLLVDELGLEPGQELRDLQTAVLRQDPALDWVPPRTGIVATGPADRTVDRAGDLPRDRAGELPAESTPSERNGCPDWPMVGRAAQLGALLALLDRAVAGTPAYAVLTGDPGIGKTRLAAEVSDEARRRGVRVLVGRGSDDDGTPALWPWAGVLGALGQDLPRSSAGEPEDEGAGFRSWERIVAAVQAAATDRPLLVLCEDLHWFDPASLRVLRLLVETVSTGRLLVLATWRPHPPPREALAQVAESLARRHALRLSLSGLTSAQAAQVVESVTHSRPSTLQADALTRRTDGNPFFLVEFARLAAEGGDLGGLLTEVDPPSAVHDVIVRRLHHLPDDSQSLLRVASVVGREFDLATLGSASGRDADTVLDQLDPAISAGLVRDEAVGRWSFAHALVRDTVYAAQSTTRRGRLHARVARALEGTRRVSEEARHWLAAGPEHAGRGWRAAAAAAAETRRLHAHEQSAELLAAALEALAHDPEASDHDRWELLVQLVDAHRWSGRQPLLVEVEMEAVELAERLGDDERVATAASAMTLGLWSSADFGEANTVVVAALRRCLDRLPAADSRARCLALLSLANEEYFVTPVERRRLIVDEAIAMARRLDDDDLLVDALLVAVVALAAPRTARWRLARSAEAMELAAARRDERRWLLAATLHAVVEGELGLVDRMHATAAAAYREATRLRHLFALVILDAVVLPWLAMAGRFEECEERIVRMDRLMELMGADEHNQNLFTEVALGQWRGTTGEVAHRLATLVPAGLPVGASVVACLLRAGRAREAAEHLAAHPVDLDHETWLSMMTWCHAAEAALVLGDRDLAARARDLLTPYAGQSSSAGAHNAMGPVDAFLALASAGAGDLDAATAHADRAEALIAEWGIPLAGAWLRDLRTAHAF